MLRIVGGLRNPATGGKSFKLTLAAWYADSDKLLREPKSIFNLLLSVKSAEVSQTILRLFKRLFTSIKWNDYCTLISAVAIGQQHTTAVAIMSAIRWIGAGGVRITIVGDK